MKFGVREICDVVFKAKSHVKVGDSEFVAGQPVLFIDSAKTSTMEGAATTVYAQGGRGNTNLVTWEGEKTLTFTVEDALLSPIGFAVLSGAGLLKNDSTHKAYVHQTAIAQLVITAGTPATGEIDLSDQLGSKTIVATAPVFVMPYKYGSVENSSAYLEAFDVGGTSSKAGKVLTCSDATGLEAGSVFVDFYVEETTKAQTLTIDAGNFGGYYYVEASTLFRRQEDGVDLAAEIIFPNVKIQSNFTFSMASTGDPSTFTFTMDAMPGYTRFDRTKKVLCAIQIIDEDAVSAGSDKDSVDNDADADKQYPLT